MSDAVRKEDSVSGVGSVAFPSSLSAIARPVLERLVDSQSELVRPISLLLSGESVHIPYRIYCSKFALLRSVLAGGIAGTMALCLGTRHHDGYVRERCIRQLLKAKEEWVVPYVIQLLGEYVLEITVHIEQALPQLNANHYRQFLQENQAYFATTERRAISYWNEYYRSKIRRRQDIPALRVIEKLKQMR